MTRQKLLFVVGPTASGKEDLSLRLARLLGGEIVSLDSMKLYRGMDIGTAKAPAACRAEVPHHLVDVADPWETFSVARYVAEARQAVAGIRARGRLPIVSGGTPLYLKAMLSGLFEGPAADWDLRAELSARARAEGLAALHRELAAVDPPAAARIHPNDERRIVRALEVKRLTGRPISELQTQWESRAGEPPDGKILGVRRAKEDLHHRINRRAERMFGEGLVEEVRRLAADPRGFARGPRQAVGYKEVLEHLAGRATVEEALVAVKKRTRHFAKHQMTWFKRFAGVRWIEAGEGEDPGAFARRAADAWEASA